MDYKVGQIVFVVLKKQSQVFPMMIVKEITEKTLTGEEINYVVQGGQDPKQTLNLSEIDGEMFDSAENARKALTERASKSIARLIDNAVARAKEWYPNSFEQPTSQTGEPTIESIKKPAAQKKQKQVEQSTSTATVKMPDGAIVRVKLPEQLS